MKNKHYLALAKFIPEQLNSKGGAGITMSSPLLKDQLLAYPVLVCFNITFYKSPLYIKKNPKPPTPPKKQTNKKTQPTTETQPNNNHNPPQTKQKTPKQQQSPVKNGAEIVFKIKRVISLCLQFHRIINREATDLLMLLLLS